MGERLDRDEEVGAADAGENAYLASMQAQSRRRQIVVLVCGLVFAFGIAAIFLRSILSIGQMNAHVAGVFDESGRRKLATPPGLQDTASPKQPADSSASSSP